MHRKRETYLCGFASVLEEFLAIHIDDPVIVLADIGLEHGSGMRTECPVHEHLNGADPQPVIAKAGALQFVCLVEQPTGIFFIRAS